MPEFQNEHKWATEGFGEAPDTAPTYCNWDDIWLHVWGDIWCVSEAGPGPGPDPTPNKPQGYVGFHSVMGI